MATSANIIHVPSRTQRAEGGAAPRAKLLDQVRAALRTHRYSIRTEEALQGALLYGSGLRLLECLRLRVKDLDFDRNEIVVRDGKGQKDRVTLFPVSLQSPLRQHLEGVRQVHERDRGAGYGRVLLPYALAEKYPNAASEWPWQWVFPSSQRSVDPRSGIERRHHQDESVLQKAVRTAARRAGIAKAVGPHTLSMTWGRGVQALRMKEVMCPCPKAGRTSGCCGRGRSRLLIGARAAEPRRSAALSFLVTRVCGRCGHRGVQDGHREG